MGAISVDWSHQSVGVHEQERWEPAYGTCRDFAPVVAKSREASPAEGTDEPAVILKGEKECEWIEGCLWVRTDGELQFRATTGAVSFVSVSTVTHLRDTGGSSGLSTPSQLFRWPGVTENVEQFVRSSVACARGQASHPGRQDFCNIWQSATSLGRDSHRTHRRPTANE